MKKLPPYNHDRRTELQGVVDQCAGGKHHGARLVGDVGWVTGAIIAGVVAWPLGLGVAAVGASLRWRREEAFRRNLGELPGATLDALAVEPGLDSGFWRWDWVNRAAKTELAKRRLASTAGASPDAAYRDHQGKWRLLRPNMR